MAAAAPRRADSSEGGQRLGYTHEQQTLEIRQQDDPDGSLRLTLVGEIDIAVAGQLAERLSLLARARRPVRLDLSQLRFIDCRGIGAIVTARKDARRSGWTLEVDRRVSASVARIVELAGVAPLLWPR